MQKPSVILFKIGSYIPSISIEHLRRVRMWLYAGRISKRFKHLGHSCFDLPIEQLNNPENIEIGDENEFGNHLSISTWGGVIRVGNNCSIGAYAHITASNEILIGNHVLTGKFVTITDNSHGNGTVGHPIEREIYSKGKVVIGDDVWIGDKVTILPNVHIGNGAVIGSNSVVTKDIPSNSVYAGIPAKMIKKYESQSDSVVSSTVPSDSGK